MTAPSVDKVPGEMEAAQKKVIIKKQYDQDADKKIFNLNTVSASCPVMNLMKNNYNEIYLKANKVGNFILANKQRIRVYLRETPNLQLRTLQQLEQCFLKCDKERTGQITRRAFMLKLAKNNIQVN